MGKLIGIMQPTYMPWLGYFSMIDQVDEFVFLDNVQLVSRSWQVRNKIKYNGAEKILSIPVHKEKSREERYIFNTPYSGSEWKIKHLNIIAQAYRKSPYFKCVMSFLRDIYNADYDSIGGFNSTVISEICKKIGITTDLLHSSSLGVTGHKDKLLVEICKKRRAEAYLSAQGSATYIESDSPSGEFGRNGIELFYLNYEHPIYRQLGSEFLPFIGIYDLLFNEGFQQALNIIKCGARLNYSSNEFRELMKKDGEL